MKVKLLKRLRKKWNPFPETDLKNYFHIRSTIRECILEDITKYRLWYKLLTTITHKKDGRN